VDFGTQLACCVTECQNDDPPELFEAADEDDAAGGIMPLLVHLDRCV